MSRSRLRRPPGALAVFLAVLVGGGGSAGVLVAARDRANDVETIPGLSEVLATQPNDAPAENFLLVGSDSRQDVDPEAENAGVIGSDADVVGQRSDTIMILRRNQEGGAALLSIPRDLWVPVAGSDGEFSRINSAYNDGAPVLAATIGEALGIPIHHYVEVDFSGFQRLVDAIGGVEICTLFAAQDESSGLRLNPGCTNLDGAQALAYARSRHYEEFADDQWQEDQRGDIGRMERQQQFLRNAAAKVLEQAETDPFSLNRLLDAAEGALRIDDTLDLFQAAGALRDAARSGLESYTLPVVGTEIDGKSVVELADDAGPVLDFFSGTGPSPVSSTMPLDPTG